MQRGGLLGYGRLDDCTLKGPHGGLRSRLGAHTVCGSGRPLAWAAVPHGPSSSDGPDRTDLTEREALAGVRRGWTEVLACRASRRTYAT